MSLSPRPPHATEEERQDLRRNLTATLLLVLLAAGLVFLLTGLTGDTRTATAIAVSWIPLPAAFWLTRRGNPRLAGWLILVDMLGLAAYLLYTGEGLQDVAILVYAAVILIAGLLLPARSYALLVALALLSLGSIAHGQAQGWVRSHLERHRRDAYINFATAACVLSVAAGVTRLLANHLRRSLQVARRAEQHLGESESRLRLALEAAGMGAWEWDVANRRLTWTEGIEGLLGVGPGRFEGTPEVLLPLVHPDDRELVSRVIGETLSGTRQEFHFEHRVQWPSGQVRWLEAKGRVSGDEVGRRRLVQGTLADVTRRKLAEEKLRDREKLAAIGTLVAGVAHEVRTPLFSISATLDAYEAELAAPGARQEPVSLLRSQVKRLSNLMTELLEFAHPAPVELMAGGIEDAVSRAVRSCSPLAEHAGIQLRSALARGLPSVKRDGSRLEQVFQNLLANAIQHAPRGSAVTLSARSTLNESGQGVGLTVEDEGPGIRPEDLSRIFEQLFSRRKGGIGLGLSIVKRIVEEHGGKVSAANRPSGGAVFAVFLPAAAISEPAPHGRV